MQPLVMDQGTQTEGFIIPIVVEPVVQQNGERVMFPTYRWAPARPIQPTLGSAERPIVIEDTPPSSPARPETPDPAALQIDLGGRSSEAEE